ncbi:unnamed protein product [Mycena citricolor]|uniref:1-phosphatidylinositol-4-phosphate 5-kinase n=2 Tax=Mycena citricolor TaxID=2018698 RepID=A0AAD2H844_9AGAR|nr:unnamed protein product [Mycena citricolor]CAK5269162.1 unnamed protein product [Mycena citricolor]
MSVAVHPVSTPRAPEPMDNLAAAGAYHNPSARQQSSSTASYRTAPSSRSSSSLQQSQSEQRSHALSRPPSHPHEVHIVKVTGDQDSYFLPHLDSTPHGQDRVGPPPPSPPASVDPGDDIVDPPPTLDIGRSVLYEEPEQLRESAVTEQTVVPTGEQREDSERRPHATLRSLSDVATRSYSPTHQLPAAGPLDTSTSAHTELSIQTASTALPSDYLQPPAASRPTRRNTIGSTGVNPLRTSLHTQHGSQPHVFDGEELEVGLASDIQQHADQIRRERMSKRAKQQQEAEAALTRSAPKRDSANTRDDVVLVGNLIGEDHVNYVLMYNMLTGIRIGVSRCQAKIKRPLTEEDFSARHKYSFDIVGNELTPSAKYDFKFKDYAPLVFRELREDYFHLDPADYLLSLTAKYILSELGSPGKSGSFFYFSRDYRFIIKTIRHSEHKFLLSVLKQYHTHVKNNPHTLLSRFYGLHRVKLPRGHKIHFVIMNNLFPPHRDIHETFDLKGSTVGREYSEAKAAENPRAVLKDLNWINRGKMLELGPEKRALLTEQLRRDAELLRTIHVMDYSLLVGIHNMERGNRDNVRRNTLKVFSPDLPPGMSRRVTSTAIKGSARVSSPEAIAMRRAMRESDPKRLGHGRGTLRLPEEDTGDRRDFLFYRDEGGLRATDEANDPTETIYYLGVIDILTPYSMAKKLEHFWKGLRADRHKISPVEPTEYSERFFEFMKAIMRGGSGGERFKAE